MRPVPLLRFGATLAVGLVLLSGCASTSSPAATSPAATDGAEEAAAEGEVCSAVAGPASDSVTVTGEFGAEPEVDFAPGITAATTERTLVLEGDGDILESGASAEVAYSIFNGETGEVIEAYGYADAEPVTFAASTTALLPGLAKTIGCEPVGSRIVSVIPPAESWDGVGNEEIGVSADASLVAVIDIEGLIPTRATGADQEVPDGLPQVTLAEDGTPTIAVPSTDAPDELQIAVLKKGEGATVPDDATVTVQYLGVDWDTGETFDQSWDSAPTSFALSGVVPGFAQAIAGQSVGSQVLAVIPPALGYGEANAEDQSGLAGKTLVFVIDILAIN